MAGKQTSSRSPRGLQAPLLEAAGDEESGGRASPSLWARGKRWLARFLRGCRAHTQDFAIATGPVVALLVLLLVELEDDTGKSVAMLAAMSWVFIWWVTEAIPLAITALVPLFLLPFLEIETASVVAKSYANDTMFLILGSFILAAAVRYHNLHKRMAIRIVLMFGSDPRLLLFGFCLGSALISFWVDNAAAAAMLMPMAVGVQQKVHAGFHPEPAGELHSRGNQPPSGHSGGNEPPGGHSGENEPPDGLSDPKARRVLELKRSLSRHLSLTDDELTLITMDPDQALRVELDFCRGVVISIAIAVTIGGMATLTGNAVNLVFTGIWETDFPKEDPIYYLQWMLFAVPLSLILVLVLWVLVCIFFCPPSAVKPISASLHSAHMEEELAKLGPITSDQIVILVIFLILIVLWITKSLTGDAAGWASLFDDYPANGTVTVLMAVVLFVIPNPSDPKQKLMNWAQCKDIPWNVLLLVGGGFALADGIKASGLSDVITSKMSFLQSTPYWAITPAIASVTAVATEFTSNSAIASIFVPLAAELALSMNRHPLFLMVPAALASQFSYMLPIATGPNAVAYSTDTIRVKDMAVLGLFLKIAAIVLLSILMPTLGVVVFNTNSPIQT